MSKEYKDHITYKQFKSQPKEVQDYIMKCWKQQVGDYIVDLEETDDELIITKIISTQHSEYKLIKTSMHSYDDNLIKHHAVWLPKETQLRQFVEEIFQLKIIQISYTEEPSKFDIRETGFEIILADDRSNYSFKGLGHDLIEAYFELACNLIQMKLDRKDTTNE